MDLEIGKYYKVKRIYGSPVEGILIEYNRITGEVGFKSASTLSYINIDSIKEINIVPE